MWPLAAKAASSPLGRRLLGGALAVSVAAGAYFYVTGLHAKVAGERVARERAEASAADLRDELAEVRVNAKLNRKLLEAEQARERQQDHTIETIVKEVYRDRSPTPAECRAVLAPVSSALDGLRQLQRPDAVGRP